MAHGADAIKIFNAEMLNGDKLVKSSCLYYTMTWPCWLGSQLKIPLREGKEVIRDHEGGSSSGQISVSGRTAFALPPEMHMVCTHYDQLRCQTEIFSEDRNDATCKGNLSVI